jgi:hypothetical protein
MKKVYLLFGIMMSLLLIGVVKAEGPYNLDFETAKKNVPIKNVGYKDGYLVIDYDLDEDAVTLIRYDSKGKVAKQKNYSNIELMDLTVKDDNIYILYDDSYEDSLYLARLDENLAIQKKVPVEDDIHFFYIFARQVGAKVLKAENNKVYYVKSGNNNQPVLVSYKSDLTGREEKEFASNEIYNYYPELKAYEFFRNNLDSEFTDVEYLAFDYKNNLMAYTITEEYSCRTANHCYETSILLYTDSGTKKFEKTISSDYLYASEIRIIDNYVAVIASTRDNSDILIYDFNGNLIQTIKSPMFYGEIVDTENGFVVIQSSCDFGMVKGASSFFDDGDDTIPKSTASLIAKSKIQMDIVGLTNNPCCEVYGEFGIFGPITHDTSRAGNTQKEAADLICQGNHQVYYLYRNVETKVTQGKGKIQVVKQQKPGEPVEFIITPDEGYVLGKVKVTDANGKTVVFTQNRFTMPSADVTIEVEFLVANAKTADIAIIGVSIIAIIAAGIVFTQYRKIKLAK